MSVTLRKIRNPQAQPITFDSHARCMYWAGCAHRATHNIPMFMGEIKVCARHAD